VFNVDGAAEAETSASTICTGRTTKTTTRTSVPAFRQTIFSATSRISPIPSGRSCAGDRSAAFTSEHLRKRVERR